MVDPFALRAVGPRVPGVPRVEERHGLPPDHVVTLAQEEIRRIFEVPSGEIVAGLHRHTWSAAQVSRYAETVRARLDGFTPDLVLTLTPADFLRTACVGAGTGCRRERRIDVFDASLPNAGRSKGHHTEVAFALPAEPGDACVEVANVELGEAGECQA